jgi:signal transduction histidine kinase
MKHKDGHWVWVLGRGKIIEWDNEGEPLWIFGTHMDISERKQAEDEIRRLNIELEERVIRRTAQLEASNKELEAFAYSVSHDLRAPLRAMEGFSSALLTSYKDQVDEQGQHYLERIQQASQRMGQLISDLLSLSRITRSELTSQRVDLCDLARDIHAELKKHDPDRQVIFILDEALIVQGDSHLLRIALKNLLENAWKFSATRHLATIQVGQMTLADYNLKNSDWDSRLPQSEFSKRPESFSGNLQSKIYYVSDNGVGFDMAYTNKLFTPFQRLHAMHEFPGTGIGLAIVQRIITRHGGRIWPIAQVGHGASFYFTIGGSA